jgi:Uri superfamily endonuclease
MDKARTEPPPAPPDAPGAYVLVIDLDRPLRLDIARLPPAVLPAGRYAYCGSAYGPGGLRARVARHLRPCKAVRWHVDRLTEAGRVASVHAVENGRECELLARLLDAPGASVPVAGFGSSDCRRCPAHLVALPEGFAASRLPPAFP